MLCKTVLNSILSAVVPLTTYLKTDGFNIHDVAEDKPYLALEALW